MAGTVHAYETNVPAEKEEAVTDTWISQAVCDDQRPRALETSAQKGAGEALGIGILLMPRKNSLTHADFVRADMAKFRRERGSLFMLSFGVLAGQKPAELKTACVVSKKTAARAAARNLIKRRWRAAMLRCLPAVPTPLTLIFYAMRQAKGASYLEIKSDVERLVVRASAKLLAS